MADTSIKRERVEASCVWSFVQVVTLSGERATPVETKHDGTRCALHKLEAITILHSIV